MQIINDPKLDFKDVLIQPKVSYLESRSDVVLERTFNHGYNGQYKFSCVPIIAANMHGVGTVSMLRALSELECMTALCKHETDMKIWKEVNTSYYSKAIMSAGMSLSELDRITKVYSNDNRTCAPKFLCLDVANGYNMAFVEFIQEVRKVIPDYVFLIAGNVVTAPQTEQLILAGADAVKVGIGSGSVCTTRKVTGVGYPQLSAIIECADAAHGLNGFVISDGGCQVPGDVCKAFGAGADFVMLGGMLAGHDESELQKDMITGKYEFFGSSSKTAQEVGGKELASYRSSEGKAVQITPRGPVTETMNHVLGGLRSCCTYVGAGRLKELSKRTTFIKVQNGHQYNTVFGDSNEVS